MEFTFILYFITMHFVIKCELRTASWALDKRGWGKNYILIAYIPVNLSRKNSGRKSKE
jgi:hypothetical protein